MNDTAALLEEVCTYFRRFLVVSPDQLTALALWTMHTYVYEAFTTTPYLIVTSAEMRSGKSRVFECLECVVHAPFYGTGMTEAVLFRIIDQFRPTLLLDEMDRMFKERRGELSERQEMIVAIVNLSYRRKGQVPRVGLTREIEFFKVYCPKALAGIGHMPHTIEDRGVPIRMRRKLTTETVEDWDEDITEADGETLRTRLEGWGAYARLQLARVKPEMPRELDDRARQSYKVLVAIADLAEEGWPERARDALVNLRAEAENPKESQGMRLLRDVATFADVLVQHERMPTRELLDFLYVRGDSPWEEWWGPSEGKKAARRLALVLAEYDVKPEQMWVDGAKARGYETAAILGAVARYGAETVDTVGSADLQGFSPTVLGQNGSIPTVLNGGSESADLQGFSPDSYRSTVSDFVESGKPGSDEWLATASMDELREFYEGA